MTKPIYIADTSALFAAWLERYPPELFGPVWRFVDGLGGRLLVCEEVRREIDRHAADSSSNMGRKVGELNSWLRNSAVNMELSLLSLTDDVSRAVQQGTRRIASGWPHWNAVRHTNSADPWVIAYAMALGCRCGQ